MKKEVAKELKKFYSAVEQTADSVFITNCDGVIEYVNPAFEKMTGFKKEEALGNTPRIIKSGLQSASHYKKLWSTILSGKTFRSTVVNRRKDKRLFYADHTITPIKDNKGKVTHFVGIWKDTTKQVELEKRKEEFMAMAAHELKNPLAVIKGYSQMLQKSVTDKKGLDYLLQINFQIDKVSKLINDFFDVSRIEIGKLTLHKSEFDLNLLIEKIVSDFKHSISSHKIIKDGKIGKKVVADPLRVGQVLINLLTNAVKYSPPKSKIVVSLESNQRYGIVCIKDFGIGIVQSEQNKIFERFYQINGKEQKGFGLGLYIAAEIIRQHGGKIWVESKEGKGSEFFFSLPY